MTVFVTKGYFEYFCLVLDECSNLVSDNINFIGGICIINVFQVFDLYHIMLSKHADRQIWPAMPWIHIRCHGNRLKTKFGKKRYISGLNLVQTCHFFSDLMVSYCTNIPWSKSEVWVKNIHYWRRCDYFRYQALGVFRRFQQDLCFIVE